jgi:hypothetical protein
VVDLTPRGRCYTHLRYRCKMYRLGMHLISGPPDIRPDNPVPIRPDSEFDLPAIRLDTAYWKRPDIRLIRPLSSVSDPKPYPHWIRIRWASGSGCRMGKISIKLRPEANLIVAFHWQNEIISLWKRSIILFNIALVCLLHAVSRKSIRKGNIKCETSHGERFSSWKEALS